MANETCSNVFMVYSGMNGDSTSAICSVRW